MSAARRSGFCADATGMVELRGAHNLLNTWQHVPLPMQPDCQLKPWQQGVHRVSKAFRTAWNMFARCVVQPGTTTRSLQHPERTLAAIRFSKNRWCCYWEGVIKNLPWKLLAEELHRRVDHVILFGEAAGKIAEAIGRLNLGRG
jgi:hypothetical protein